MVKREGFDEDQFCQFITQGDPGFALLALDLNGTILSWNKGAETIFGYEESEIIGENVRRLHSPEDNRFDTVGKELLLAKLNGLAEDDRWGVTKEGARIWLAGLTAAQRDASGAVIGFCKMVRERTIERTTEDEIKRSLKAGADFSYVAAHELQQPLATSLGFIELVKAKGDSVLDEKGKKFLKLTHEAILKMRQLVADLLEHARTGKKHRVEQVHMGTVFDNAAAMLDGLIRECGATVSRQNLPVVEGSSPELERLFRNLLSNSLKFRSKAAPVITCDAQQIQEKWHFCFRDNGVGIAPEEAEKVFGGFHRLQGDIPGTGLGLSICQKIVEAHGGTIWIEDEDRDGTTFRFTLPA